MDQLLIYTFRYKKKLEKEQRKRKYQNMTTLEVNSSHIEQLEKK